MMELTEAERARIQDRREQAERLTPDERAAAFANDDVAQRAVLAAAKEYLRRSADTRQCFKAQYLAQYCEHEPRAIGKILARLEERDRVARVGKAGGALNWRLAEGGDGGG